MSNHGQVFVAGAPVPKGSLRNVGGRMISTNQAKRVAWEQAIRASAAKAWGPGREPSKRPVEIILRFGLERPKTVRRLLHTVKPDIDKLVRCVLDALSGVVYVDDAQVIGITTSKSYQAARYVGVRIEWTLIPVCGIL